MMPGAPIPPADMAFAALQAEIGAARAMLDQAVRYNWHAAQELDRLSRFYASRRGMPDSPAPRGQMQGPLR